MSKAKYPQPVTTTAKPVAINIEEVSGTIEAWFKCREERIKAQFKLLHSCKSNEDVNRYKEMGLFDFEGTVF